MTAMFDPAAPAWNALYRTAGAAGLLFVLLGVSALTLYAVNPPPVSGGEETLRFIADHKASDIAQQILWLVPSLFGLIVFVALFVALFVTSPSLSVLGFTVGAASWTALLAVPVTSEGLSRSSFSVTGLPRWTPWSNRRSSPPLKRSWLRTTRPPSPEC